MWPLGEWLRAEMTLLNSSFTPPIRRAHPGGFFWSLDRSRRIQTLLSLAGKLKGIVVIAGSESEAVAISERLTLRGVPVLLAANPDAGADTDLTSTSTSALITTADFIEKNGPIHSPMTVHLRPPFSPRSYAKRLRSAVSAVHVTFVTPEDEQRAGELCSSLSASSDEAADAPLDLTDLVDLTRSKEVAAIEQPRRRFTFRSK